MDRANTAVASIKDAKAITGSRLKVLTWVSISVALAADSWTML
jgi:hypothetical protein